MMCTRAVVFGMLLLLLLVVRISVHDLLALLGMRVLERF
jgi:hypothetical protein